MIMATALKSHRPWATLLKRLIPAALLVLPGLAAATLVTSLPGGVLAPMPAVNYNATVPRTFNGITWSSTYRNSVFGYTGKYGVYGFGSNGNWNAGLGPMAGLNTSVGTMTFAFATPVSGVGGFLNWSTGTGSASIAAYDITGHLIESHAVSFRTDGATNSGQFLGFRENQPIISKFTLTGAFIGITNMKAMPIPATGWLFGSALIGLAALSRRKTASPAAEE